MNKLIRIALTFLLVMTTGGIQAEIVIYPVPQGIYYARHNDDYTVKVRQVGEKDWVDVNEYINDEEVLDYAKAIVIAAIKSKGFSRANQETLCHIKKDFELFFPIES
jgi:hypothetical protein